MGIDVGTATTGWSILDYAQDAANHMQLVDYGVILTKAGVPMPERLVQIHEQLDALMTKYQPHDTAVESLFFFKNQTTVMTVSQSRGVILMTAQQHYSNIFEYTPLQVKQGITGFGRAEKPQVQKMVQMILGLKEIPKPDDAADAIAIAVCHFHTNQYNQRIAASKS